MRKRTKSLVLCVMLALVPGAMAPARAQYVNPHTGTNWNNPMSSFLDTVIRNNMQMQSLMTSQMIARSSLQRSLQRGARQRRLSPRERVVVDRFAKYRGTMFTPGPSVMPARLAQMFVREPGERRRQMQALFTKLLDIYNQRSRQLGAPPNDLARTLAYCIGANLAYYRQQEVSHAGFDVLRGKIRAALAGDAKFRSLSNAQKQQMSDTIVIMTHFVAAGFEAASEAKLETAKQDFRKLAGINLQGMLGVAPQRVVFAPTGLVIQ